MNICENTITFLHFKSVEETGYHNFISFIYYRFLFQPY